MSGQGIFNVVVVARNFNPTFFSQLWFLKIEVFPEGDLKDNFIYTPMAVSLTTPEVAFLAVPDRIQLGFAGDKPNYSKLIDRILGAIVQKLPHTPFQAVGFNMTWNLLAKNSDEFSRVNRQLFLSSENPLAKSSAEADCRFGFYLSKNLAMGRMRLDIKPMIAAPVGTVGTEGLQLNFNFNRDLQEESKIEVILEFLQSWDMALSLSSDMVKAVGRTWSS